MTPKFRWNAITDIDLIQNGTLWEQKSAVFATDPQDWVAKNIDGKFEKYMRARALIPGYENAPIGFQFSGMPADPDLVSAIENSISQLRTANPTVNIQLDWGN